VATFPDVPFGHEDDLILFGCPEKKMHENSQGSLALEQVLVPARKAGIATVVF